MNIIINTSSMVPIYEQIVEEIRNRIIRGELSAGDVLPSVRVLSRELKISALTVKKAYDFLEQEGFTATVHGKGTYVTGTNLAMIAEMQRQEIEQELDKLIKKAREYGMEDQEIRGLMDLLMEE